MFENYKEIENFLEYGEGIDSVGEQDLRSSFIYSTLGYRKYADSEFLNYFPNELLAKMIFGVITNSDLNLDFYEDKIEESKKCNYKEIRHQEFLRENEYMRKLQDLKIEYGKK